MPSAERQPLVEALLGDLKPGSGAVGVTRGPTGPYASACRARAPLSALRLSSLRPDVGALMALCEESYGLIQRLAPGLSQLTGRLTSSQPGVVDLHLEIQDQSRYTTELRLAHLFRPEGEPLPRREPDALLRVYHDARQIEVLELRQSMFALRKDYAPPALLDKWQANLFLSKWLVFCLRQGHRFGHCRTSTAGPMPFVSDSACLSRP